jgi:hypothetical protein
MHVSAAFEEPFTRRPGVTDGKGRSDARAGVRHEGVTHPPRKNSGRCRATASSREGSVNPFDHSIKRRSRSLDPSETEVASAGIMPGSPRVLSAGARHDVHRIGRRGARAGRRNKPDPTGPGVERTAEGIWYPSESSVAKSTDGPGHLKNDRQGLPRLRRLL